MANLIETPQWETGVYQIETTDPVVGGPDGISNIQAKQLANRTAYLKTTLESLATELAALGITDVAGLQAALDGKTPWAVADAVISAAGLTPDHTNLGQLLSALQAMGLRDATETLKGRVELATSAEVLAGTDAVRAVTPAGLMSAFGKSLASSGYQKFPGGMIIQWFSGVTSGTNGADSTFNFPIAFPNGVFIIIHAFNETASPYSDATQPLHLVNKSLTSATFRSYTGGQNGISAVALGY